jgi:deoxyribodipyrimidine photo-lyase
MSKYELCIFIFRRDLRLNDNHALIEACKISKTILPLFIFDKSQIDETPDNKDYRSLNAIQFMLESLDDLNDQLKEYKSRLFCLYGNPLQQLQGLIKEIIKTKQYEGQNILVAYNSNFSPYATERDNEISQMCFNNGVDVITSDSDFLMCPPNTLLKSDGEPFMVFSAFYKNALKQEHYTVVKNTFKNYMNSKTHFKSENITLNEMLNKYEKNEFIAQHGGRHEALTRMKIKLKQLKDYDKKRDILDYETSMMSAHLNFGCVSEREFYYAIKDELGIKHELIKQMYWRDFFKMVLRSKVTEWDKHIKEPFERIKKHLKVTKAKESMWNKMMEGQTGFLIVDAAINELKQTGFMHNRGRLIVGKFAYAYLQIDILNKPYGLHTWFSKYLVDCSFEQNLGNCWWITGLLDAGGMRFSKGMGSRPISPANEHIKKFDPECKYIKKWLPQLKDVPIKQIIKWDVQYNEELHPKPLFNAKERWNEWVKLVNS